MSDWIKCASQVVAVYAGIYIAFLAASTGWTQGHEAMKLRSDLMVLERCREIITDKDTTHDK
ncbi:hypothetical protein R5W24_000546 [Gemmata sp. JC717]|uniref:hypothetical protein n=1 Tax=Gemmata algarum TaxID=2975278 RepID=UPI0021BAC26A|nr:hypothetical protein [Gemmata algarum]MDY3551470.1 hypothetical protein [Gemmata algarum]